MAYIMGKNGLTLGQKESNFKNQQFIVSNCKKIVEKNSTDLLAHLPG